MNPMLRAKPPNDVRYFLEPTADYVASTDSRSQADVFADAYFRELDPLEGMALRDAFGQNEAS